MNKITRRNFLKIAVSTGALSFLGLQGISCSRKKKELFVYNWAYYVSDKTIPTFEKEFKVKITYDNYSTNEEMQAKIQAGAVGYDLIFPSDYMVTTMSKQNLLEELNMKNIPNFKYIEERFKNLEFDPGNKYSIPYFWGTTGIGYNSDKVKDKVDSWSILWDEKYKGRISMLDDIRGVFNPALKLLNYSINTTDPTKIEEAKQMLRKQKPLVKAYTADTYVDFLKSGDIWLAQGYSGDVFQALKVNKTIKFIIPKEGTDIWIDNMCIPKGAKNKEIAEKFVNYILRPEVIADISNFTWYANANSASLALIKPEIRDNPVIFPPKEVLDKCEFQKDLKEVNKLYEKAYNNIKSV
ncbi:MAG: transporter substrate-binding protein [Candidatus Poribacteria bacterium]|nr:transporter substrate-binding protein [Candidatus Poribacteria bacterium]